MQPAIQVVAVNVGKPTTFTYQGKEVVSGIWKSPTDQPLFLSRLNFDGDAQADLVYHGGPDKAVCVYPFEHYAHWEHVLNQPLAFGAFGENLTVTGMTEAEVCIGDTFRLGEAIVQVSQPRQPCHKLAKKFHQPDLPVYMQESGRTGFYFRVLKEGWVREAREIQLLQRHPMQVSVSFANQIMHHDKRNTDGIKRLLDIPELSRSWRKTLEKRLAGGEADTEKRLKGE